MRIAGEDVPGLRTEESWANVGERNIISNGWGQYLLVQKAVDTNRD
jgi:hypothetical protein